MNWPFKRAAHSVVHGHLLVVLHLIHCGRPVTSKLNDITLNVSLSSVRVRTQHGGPNDSSCESASFAVRDEDEANGSFSSRGKVAFICSDVQCVT